MLIASGHVRLSYEKTVITCDRAVVWRADQEAYVEGNVRVKRPDSEVTAERAYINWASRQSMIMGFRGRSIFKSQRLNWYITSPQIAGLSDGLYTARDVSITTCSFARPHHGFKADFAEVIDDVHVLTRGTRYYIHGHQVTPRFPMYQDLEYDWPWMRWGFGNSSEFGTFIRSDWRYRPFRFKESDLDRQSVGQRPDDEFADRYKSERTWSRPKPHPLHDLEFYLNLDYLSKRGPAFGIDSEYDLWRQGKDARGELDSYFVPNDTGHDISDYDLGIKNRYRVKYFHQQRMPDGWELDLEFNKYSDRGFQEEYFEQEYLEDKRPETRAYLKRGARTWAWYLEGVFRTDDFRDQTEYLPRTGINTFSESLPGGLLWESAHELAYIRGLFSKVRARSYHTPADIFSKQLANNAYDFPQALTLREEMSHNQRILRFHSYNRVSRPFDVGFLSIEPWVGMNQTLYERTLPEPTLYPLRADEHHNQWRGQFLSGVDLACEFWRVYDDVQNETFELSGLRHIITPEIRYISANRPTVAADKLYDFDNTDNLAPLDRISFGLRNQLQTHRDGSVVNFVDLDMNIYAYPNANRDGPADESRWPGRRRGNDFSDLDIDLQVRPWRKTRLFANADVDLNEITHSAPGDWRTLNVGVATRPSDRWELFVGNRYEEHVASTTTLGFTFELTKKWTLLVTQEYDWRAAEAYDSELIFRRDMHAWTAELAFQTDEGDSSKMVSLNFYPKTMRAPVRKTTFVRDVVEARDDDL